MGRYSSSILSFLPEISVTRSPSCRSEAWQDWGSVVAGWEVVEEPRFFGRDPIDSFKKFFRFNQSSQVLSEKFPSEVWVR